MTRLLAAFLLAFGFAVQANAAEEFERHALTVSMVEKYKAATKELEKSIKKKDDDEDAKDNMSVDDFAREIDRTPGAKPILKKHGLSSREYALTTLALFQAGFWLAMEPSMDKKKAAIQYAAYPAEVRGNIELLRKNPQLLK